MCLLSVGGRIARFGDCLSRICFGSDQITRAHRITDVAAARILMRSLVSPMGKKKKNRKTGRDDVFREANECNRCFEEIVIYIVVFSM